MNKWNYTPPNRVVLSYNIKTSTLQETLMTSSKTYIVNDQATETDALDFTPYVETLADIIQTGDTPLNIGVFGT